MEGRITELGSEFIFYYFFVHPRAHISIQAGELNNSRPMLTQIRSEHIHIPEICHLIGCCLNKVYIGTQLTACA